MEGLPINLKENSCLYLRRRFLTCRELFIWNVGAISWMGWNHMQDTSLRHRLRLFMVASLDDISCCLHVHYCSKEAVSKSWGHAQSFSCLWMGNSFDYRRNCFRIEQTRKEQRRSNFRVVLDRLKTGTWWFALMVVADRNILGCCCLYTCLCVLRDVEMSHSGSGNLHVFLELARW